MRVLRELQEFGQTAQRSPISSLSRAQQFINEWELRCMVLASFSLQVFLLFFSGFRKRYYSRVLTVLLWLAYLSADSLAVYILGRLTLRGGSGSNRLALFWAPFLLLHLGGQETMTAFSMEDNALWKRHLLSLATQVPMAIYVVSKQLSSGADDRRLVAPMVLMFVAGTAKYAERIWALKRAGSVAPGGASSQSTSKRVSRASTDAAWHTQGHYGQLRFVIAKKQERNFEVILDVAAQGFKLSLHFLMDMTPSISMLHQDVKDIKQALDVFRSSEDRVRLAYKLAEVNLSLIYDYLYTKFGTRHFHMIPFCNAFHKIVALALTSSALGLFVRGTTMTSGRKDDMADVVISYVLLVGAVVLEICSIFMSFVSSCWAYKTVISCSLTCPVCRDIPGAIAGMLCVARHLHPGNKGEWSEKMAQYNLIQGCIKAKQESPGLFRRTMRWVGVMGEQRAITRIGVSPEVKKLVLDKLLDIAATQRVQEWDIGVGKFRGQWAQWVVETKQDQHQQISAGYQQVLQVSNIQGLEFVSSVLLWHIVTDICLLPADDDVAVGGGNSGRSSSSSKNEEHLADNEVSSHHEANEDHLTDEGSSHHEANVDGFPPSRLRGPIRELSDYVMYIIADCGAMAGSEGHYVVSRGQKEVSRWLLEKHGGGFDRRKVIEEIRDEDSSFFHEHYYPVLDRARRVASDLLNAVGEAGDRWELISAVWLEMLCYVAHNCGAAFHAKHLATGGEFVTHVKMVLFMVGVPFLRDVKESLLSEPGNIYS